MPVQAAKPATEPVDQIDQKVEFSFPFKPYDIQDKLMRTVYETLDKAKIGLLESPTGTGEAK